MSFGLVGQHMQCTNVPELPALPAAESGVGSKGALYPFFTAGPWLTVRGRGGDVGSGLFKPAVTWNRIVSQIWFKFGRMKYYCRKPSAHYIRFASRPETVLLPSVVYTCINIILGTVGWCKASKGRAFVHTIDSTGKNWIALSTVCHVAHSTHVYVVVGTI